MSANITSAIDPLHSPNPPSPSPSYTPNPKPVSISLSALADSTVPLSLLSAAFSPTSLGILIVTDLPPHYASLRTQVLASASQLARLPAAKLEELVDAEAKYLVGWSHGKETLKEGGGVDEGKGSFYVNCDFYAKDSRHRAAAADAAKDDHDDAAEWPNFREYTAPSLWPSESDIPLFRANLQGLVTLIIDVAVLVARACDRYAAEHVENYPAPAKIREDDGKVGYLEHMVRTSRTTKARLLHYFPPLERQNDADADQAKDEDVNEKVEDNWCATHLDHGCLTGLTSAMFTDESSVDINELPSSPDPEAGLYIHSRSGEPVKVSIPRDALAFQTGEALQLVTRGKFMAVPHFVRGVSKGGNVGRNTLAVFTQPNLGDVVDWDRQGREATFGEFARRTVEKNVAAG